MIIINSEETHISEEELFIGFAGDNLHSTRQFELTGVSDTDCKYVLYLTFDNDATTNFELDSKVENCSTYLTWNIKDEHVLKGGLVKARIKSIKKDGTIYYSPSMYFVASPLEDNTSDNSNGENNLTEEIKNLIDVMAAKVEDFEQDYVPTARTVAQLSLENDITAEQLHTALSTYPILTSSSLDYVQQNIKKGQLAIYTSYDGKTHTIDFYYGYTGGVATLVGGTTVNNSILPSIVEKYLEDNPIEVDGYVPQTRTIAGIDLADDITADELYTSLNIKPHTGNYPIPTESTVGQIGQIYSAIQNKKAYICNDISTGDSGKIYHWDKISNPDIKTVLDSESTDDQVVGAKLFYDTVGDIESLLEALL